MCRSRSRAGEVLGLVGESGSGKSMTGYSIMGLSIHRAASSPGNLHLEGRDLRAMSEEDLRQLRGNRIAMIFQDPMMTLNPVLRIDDQMIEAILAHRSVGRAAARERGARGACEGRHPVARRATRRLSASILRRHAPARRDRDRAPQRPGAHHRRRADDGARRDDPGPDPVRDAEADARDRRGDDLDHARPVGDRRARRSRLRDVRGPDRRAGDGIRCVVAAAPSLHARPPRLGARR